MQGMEYCNLADIEIKITVMKKFNNLQENSERQFNEIRKKINEPKILNKTYWIIKEKNTFWAKQYHEWDEEYNREYL